MSGLKKLVGAYLVVVGVVVAVFFIVNSLLADAIDVPSIWYVLDVLMLVGLVLALFFNYQLKREVESSELGDSISRPYLESNVLFYLTAGVTIIFLHNWLSLLANGGRQPGRQSPSVGDLGVCRHAAPNCLWADGLPSLEGRVRFLTPS